MKEAKFIDTHAHLDDRRFEEDRCDVIERAKKAGLKAIVSVGCWSKEGRFDGVEALIREHAFIYGALGIHPHDAADIDPEIPFERIRELALGGEKGKASKILAIGETGLDYHYDNAPPEAQKKLFKEHLTLARELNLPVSIHTREAWAETISILREEGFDDNNNTAGGIFHCFSGGPDEAAEALKMGFYLSISGVVTFKGADKLREAIKATPMEKLLIETDCPYLAPVPNRGKRNEPAFVVETAKKIAELKGLTVEDVARITTLNAEEVFGLTAPEPARIAYKIRDSLYLNITNRCTNRCTFCPKFKSYTVKGHFLRLGEEPTFKEVLDAIGEDPQQYDEIVFCGYGEPLLRIDLVKKLGLLLKKRGCKIRIDTDGLANLANGRNVLPELMFVDSISVSLNAPDSETYQKIIKTPFGDAAYPAILFFIREAKRYISHVTASVVALPGLDIEACRRVVEQETGAAFRVREYNNMG